MAATNYTPIQLYYSTTSTNVPVNTNLADGELAINIADGKLFYKDSGGTVQVIATKGTGPIGGTTTQVQFNDAGALGGSSGFVYNKTTTTLTVSTLNLTNALGVSYGGTGQTTFTDGQLLIGNTSTNSLTKSVLTAGSGVTITNGNGSITIAATGTGGTVTSVGWTGGIVSVANATTTPAFTIAGTSGGIPYFASGTTWASSAVLAANAIVLGGGAAVAPATTTTGTGVVTAIGNNVNTTGGIVTQFGVLGASALLIGGGSGTAIQSTTTGTGVITAIGNTANAASGLAVLNASGILDVAKGGTGLASGTSGGVLYYSATGTLASSAALAANAIVIGGGAGVAPATTTTGTGVLTALGNNANATGGFATINGTATLTNKRIDPRVSSTTSVASITPDISSFDQYAVTAQAVNLTINAPTGTPVDGNKLMFRILDNGTTRTLTWNATFTVIGVTLPTATTASKMVYVGCIYNAANTRWDVVAVSTQA